MPDVVAYFDSSGAGGTLGTLDDWAGLVAWVDTDVPADDYPCVHHLVENGWEDDLPALTTQLEDALAAHPPDTTDVEGVARELLDVVESRAEEDTAVAIGVGDTRSPTGNAGMSARLGTQLAGFVSAGNDWNEFTTWAHSLPPGEYTTVKGLSVNAQVGDAGALDNELRQAAVEAPPETDGAVAVAGRLLSILGDYAEPTGRLSVVANELSHSDLERRLEALLFERYMPVGRPSVGGDLLDSMGPSPYLIDVYDDHIIYRWMDKTYTLGYTVDDQTDKVTLDTGDPVEVARVTEYVPVDNAGAPTVNQIEYLSPAEACEVLSEGEFEGEELSPDEEEFLRERCSGFTANAGKGGLSTPDVTPEKACKIIKDGTIRGKELTPRQRGLFGIICGRRKKPRGPARNQATEESSQTLVDNAFCATGAGGGVDPSCSPSGGKQGAEPPTPTMPGGHKEWGKVLKPFTEAELGQMADRLISHVGDPSFKEQVEWQAANYQGLHGSGLAKRPEALRARAALATYVSDTSNTAGMARKAAESDPGASSGHFVNTGDERKAWRAAWKIANGHPVSNVANTESSQTNEVRYEGEETSMRLTDEQRRIIVDNLVANTGCGCHGQTMPWPNERAALEKLTDNELAFADGCRKALVQNHASGPGGGSVATGPTAAQGAQRVGGGPTVDVVDPSQVIVPVATPVKAPANMAEALATYGTAQDREVWNSALAIHAHEKASVIETIVANVTGEARERLIARLQTKNIDELRELAVLGAQHRVQPQPLSPTVNWFGASAAAVAPPVQEEPLSSPVYSFERRSA
jgi:hypothetical protein